jgi:hypothetical protein
VGYYLAQNPYIPSRWPNFRRFGWIFYNFELVANNTPLFPKKQGISSGSWTFIEIRLVFEQNSFFAGHLVKRVGEIPRT